MSPKHFHSTKEEDDKSGASYERWSRTPDRGAYCGRQALMRHNNDIWYANWPGHNGMFNMDSFDDLCFAWLGNFQTMHIYASYIRENGSTFRGWMTVTLGFNTATWQYKCIKLTTYLDTTAHGAARKKTRKYFDVGHIRVTNDEGSQIFFDEVMLGKIRGGTKLTLTQTKKALSFNGHVPTNVNLYLKYSSSWGAFIRIDWYAGHHSMCGWRSILPTIHAPTGAYNTAGTTGMLSTNGWFRWGGLKPGHAQWGEPYDGFIAEHIRPPGYATDTPVDYRRMELSYKRTDRSRQHVLIHVVRSSIINPEWNTDFKLTMAGQPGTLSMRMTRNLYAHQLREKLIETWPLLGHTNLNIRVDRTGECNGGYAFEIRAQEHGKMPKLSMTSTIRNKGSRLAKAYIKDKYDTGVLTAVLPGSVLATGHHLPQVVVTANGQRSSCRDNCDFEWSAGFTPVLKSVTASSNVIKIKDPITFTFETGKYEGNLDNALFFISGVKVEDCGEVTVSGVTKSVTCLVGRVPVTDTHTFEMIIPELGNANFEPPQKFSTILRVDETKPSRGSRNGGTRVSVTGSGFAADDVLTVLMGGARVPCDPIKETVDYTTVTCITRASNQIAPGRSPTLKEISQSKFNIMGGEEFTITGTFLNPDRDCTNKGEVFIGPNKAEIISWTVTAITAKVSFEMIFRPDLTLFSVITW